MTKKKEVTDMGSSGYMKDTGCGNTDNDLHLDNDLTKVEVSQQPPLAIIGEGSGCATTTENKTNEVVSNVPSSHANHNTNNEGKATSDQQPSEKAIKNDGFSGSTLQDGSRSTTEATEETSNQKNKPSRRVSRLPNIFLTKKSSKYRLKPSKCSLGDP